MSTTSYKIRETAGPTTLTLGAVADGEYLLRSGATIVGGPGGGGAGTPSASVVTETAFAQPSAVGVSADYSRGDHTHGTPAAPTAASVGAVPTTRTITTTAPLTIDGLGSATLAADRTLAVSAASETATGVAEIATQAETDAITDDTRYVTPLKLGTTSARKIRETSGPTVMVVGAVADGEYLRRVGSAVVGGSPGGGSGISFGTAMILSTLRV